VAGYVPVALSPEDYVELLPVVWRAINAYGIKIGHRTYDAKALNPYRRLRSGVAGKQGRWEVHHDPYDISRVWVRNHYDGGWITATWTHLHTAPAPFGELAWRHSLLQLGQRGQDPVTEQEIAQAASALLDRAEQGPATQAMPTRKNQQARRVAGRTRATSGRTWPAPASPAPAPKPTALAQESEQQATETPVAEVIPLGVFDPYQEATKRW
jgi:hypothetical protein